MLTSFLDVHFKLIFYSSSHSFCCLLCLEILDSRLCMLILPCHTLPASVPLAKWSQGTSSFVSQRILTCRSSSLFIRSCVDKPLKTQLISIACLLKIKRACRKSDRTTIRLNKSWPLHPLDSLIFSAASVMHAVLIYGTREAVHSVLVGWNYISSYTG